MTGNYWQMMDALLTRSRQEITCDLVGRIARVENDLVNIIDMEANE